MMTRLYSAVFALFAALLPLYAHADTFRELVEEKILPFGDSVIGLMYALAFLFFLYGVLKYFFIGGADEESREKGKQIMVWGLLGLVILFGIWGFVKLLLSLIGVT